jgi:hypothetical protein
LKSLWRAHPMREEEAYRGKEHRFHRYVDCLHGQIEELLSNYRKIAILWFDYSYGELKGLAITHNPILRNLLPFPCKSHRVFHQGLGSGRNASAL